MPLWAPLLLYVVSLLPGLALAAISLLVVAGLIDALAHNRQVQGEVYVLVLLIALAWRLYIELPGFVRSLLRSTWRRVRRRGEGGRSR